MGILSFDLRKLVKAFDGKEMNFLVDEDGSKAADAKARQTIANYIASGCDRIPMRTEKLPDPKSVMPRSGRLERLRERLRDERAKQMQWRRAHPMLQPTQTMRAKIAALEDEIKEAEAYEPRKLAEMIDSATLDRSGVAKDMVKMHIAADYLTETAMALRENLEKLGFEDCSIFHLAKGIEEQAARFANIVCHPEFAGLSDFMSTNEKLIDALDFVVLNYLDEHLEITREVV